jgi:hypothetical protein
VPLAHTPGVSPPEGDPLAHLQQEIDGLRAKWYAMGRGPEFEEALTRYKQDGNWPFRD